MSNRPIHDIRLGHIRAAIWANETANGICHCVTFRRGYRDGEERKHTDSFRRQDLPLVQSVLNRAYTWLDEQAENHREKKERE